ncbi:hypothetical protein [Actinacidiphila acidipaludis]|uniref:IPT/TIG domain-containing protein n=1 Tax=Actinacidiphila acidipaludis TaxID=2873382 RepID=A0ABS7Q304_9ACTN|nr:hypothetical protein [Streptomyces acidipaludis]MBY8877528.1 hypothetical protein [Streptomyces acidipaludis]
MTPWPTAGRHQTRRRRTSAAAITALVTSAAVALIGWAGPTYASTGAATARAAARASVHKATAKPPAPGRTTPGRPTSGPTTRPASAPPAGHPAGQKPSGTKPAAARPSAAQLKALRAKAAARALASASPRDTQDASCGGPLAFDTVHACDAIASGGSDAYTVTTSAADDQLTIQLVATSGAQVNASLTGPDGTAVSCFSGVSVRTCATGAAGGYTLVVDDQYGSGGYTLAVSSLKSSACTPITASDLAFGSAPKTGSLAAGAASACYGLDDGVASGDALRVGGLSYEVQATVYDATGTVVCGVGQYGDTCALSGTAPYRMLLEDSYAQAASWTLSVNRLSHPAGCATLAAAPFGDPGSAVATGTLPVGGLQCRTVTLPGGLTMVSLQGGESTSGGASWQLLTAQGDPACYDSSEDVTCSSLPGAGTYTVLIENASRYEDAPYTVSLVPLASTGGCAASVGTSYDLPLLHRSFTSAVQVDCQSFDAAAGDRIDLSAGTDVYGQLTSTIVDPSGAPSCSTSTGDGSSQDGCVLTGSGPYRVISHTMYGFTGSYTMRIARLSDPAGCTALHPQVYGTAPATSTDPCWLLQVPAAGTYDVGGTGVYHLDGTRFCAQGAASCTFPAAGTYAMVFRPGYLDDTPFAPVFVSPAQTAGCVAASDRGFVSGPVSLDLSAAGVRDCLTLPTASGNGVYLVPAAADDGMVPVETVYDAKGVQQCENEYSFAVCKLTGTAPFHVVVTAPVPRVYRLTVQRTGDAGGCAGWPQTPFGASAGTPVKLTATAQTACLTLPANGHSTAELFDFANTANRLDASVRVFDAAGNQVCSSIASSTTTCRFTAGVAYTAVLVGTGTVDTYHLVRRDVSSSAACAAPASLTVGGASTGYTFTSALDSRCLRVQAATTDKLWLSVRTPAAPAKTGAELLVMDSTGTIVCWQHGSGCRVSGSASYVVAVLAAGYTGTSIPARVDTWRVGTATGWASQCTANSLSADGFAPRSGSLTETSTAYCGVMQVKPRQSFDVYLVDGNPAAGPSVDMFSSANWNGTAIDYAYQCGGSSYGYDFHCSVSGGAPATQVVVIVSPGGSTLPLPYTMQGVCRSQCSTSPKPADVTSLSPAAGPAERDNKVVLHGTNLNLGTDVGLAQGGIRSSYDPMATPVSVSADGTTLTVVLSTRGLTPGRYDVVLDLAGYTSGTRSTGYLPGGYTVTAAPPTKGGGPLTISKPSWMVGLRHKPAVKH